jgi:hypothetical protein
VGTVFGNGGEVIGRQYDHGIALEDWASCHRDRSAATVEGVNACARSYDPDTKEAGMYSRPPWCPYDLGLSRHGALKTAMQPLGLLPPSRKFLRLAGDRCYPETGRPGG